MDWSRKLVAEGFGTFCLVFAGTGAVIADAASGGGASGGGVSPVGVALTFGLVVMAMIYAVGRVSGAHINPAVTLGFFAAGRLDGRWVAPYIASQCGGALLASGLLWLVYPAHPTLGATVPTVATPAAWVIEAVLTMILMFVILSVSQGFKEEGIMAGAAIGAVVGLEALFAGPITGASMNPARSLAPAVIAGQWDTLWVYLSAPVAGALVAVGLCRCIQQPGCCPGPCGGSAPPQAA